jgi:hypothetical protein
MGIGEQVMEHINECDDIQFNHILETLIKEERWDELKLIVAVGEGTVVMNSRKGE